MVAVDLAAVVLIIGIVALSVTTVVTGISLPTIAFRRQRKRVERVVPRARAVPQRRAVTGPRVELPPIALQPARQNPADADRQRLAHEAQTAERLIERLLEADPETLAEVMTRWIRSDTERMQRDGRTEDQDEIGER